MSDVLVPKYYNTKINNHDCHIYMGGERYFPAYPAKWVEPEPPIPPEPEGRIVKRYLIKDSSSHGDYSHVSRNCYPLTTLDAYINENDETMEFDGNTYYVWRGWNQYNDDVIPDTISNDHKKEQLFILTTTLEPTIPFTNESAEFAYMLTTDSMSDETDYLYYVFLAQVNEYENGEKKVKMSNVSVRMYNYEHNIEMIGEYGAGVWDYFQYDGEMIEYNDQICFVWNRYDSDTLCVQGGWPEPQKILTNTLWIKSLPFTMESPEFVTLINYIDSQEYQFQPVNMPFDRIEYLPDTVYNPNPIDAKIEQEDVNVKTYLVDEYFEPLENPGNIQYVYDGETMEWNGKTCFVWRKDDLYGKDAAGHGQFPYPYIVLTNTLDISLPLDYNAYYFEVAFDYNDTIANYEGIGDNTIGGAGTRAKYIIRDYNTHYDPPFYIKI